MNRNIFIYIIVFSLCIACGKKSVNKELSIVDSLFQKELIDSAIFKLENISDTKLVGENKAYYSLLKGIEKLNKQDLNKANYFIDKSIIYYEKNRNNKYLAMSYLYKGCVLSYKGLDKNAIVYFKKAEELVNNINNHNLKIKIYSWLAWENEVCNNFNLAIRYGKKALNEAKLENNKLRIGSCLELLSAVYHKLGVNDSMRYYQEMAFPYIKYQPIDEQITFLGNQASYFWDNGDIKQAIKILNLSLKIKPHERTYAQLAELYMEEGNLKEAEVLWKNALKTKDLDNQLTSLYPYAIWLRKMKRDDEAWDILKQIPLLKDSLARTQQSEAIREIQNKYDLKVKEAEVQTWIIIFLSVIIFILIVAIAMTIMFLRARKKERQAQREIEGNRMMITDYTAMINEMKKSGKE